MSHERLERVPVSELDPDKLNLLPEDFEIILFEKQGSIFRLISKQRVSKKNKERAEEWRRFLIKT